MALEHYLDIKNLNSKVTVIGSNPGRREIILGFEDGSVQTYDPETGTSVLSKKGMTISILHWFRDYDSKLLQA